MLIKCPACTKTQDDINKEFLENKKGSKRKKKNTSKKNLDDNGKCLYCLDEGYINIY